MNAVIIIGGGIAGLATGYELHRRGLPFVLLESAARPGGVIFSEEVDGFIIDAGPDSLLVQKPEGIKLCEDLGLGERLVPTKPPRLAFILRDAVLHPLPASSVLGIPSTWTVRHNDTFLTGKMRMAVEAAARRGRRVDWRVHDAPLRPGSDDLSGRTAARRHSRGRCEQAFAACAVSALCRD
jgi:protoporphyrinogen oxidase